MSSSVAKSSKLKPIAIFWNIDVADQKALLDVAQVLIILEELGLPYQSKSVNYYGPYPQSEGEREILNAGPAGKLPAISDPNCHDVALFESGPIVSYLVVRYDTSYALSYKSSSERLKLEQWVHYQASRQRACVVAVACNKDKTSYDKARERVNMLDDHLSGGEWLYGDKCTYADLFFVAWNSRVPLILKDSSEGWDPAKYPNFRRWQEAMMARKSVKHVLSVMENREVKSDGKP